MEQLQQFLKGSKFLSHNNSLLFVRNVITVLACGWPITFLFRQGIFTLIDGEVMSAYHRVVAC